MKIISIWRIPESQIYLCNWFREAAIKVPPLMARPLRGGRVKVRSLREAAKKQ